MAQHIFPAMGWLPERTVMHKQRSDQGEDMDILPKIVQAPGEWRCVEVRSDVPWDKGFGPDFPLIRISSGPFAHPLPYYGGHCSTLVQPGQFGHFGDHLMVADQGTAASIGMGGPGGWIELGQEMANGQLGPNDPNGHWFRGLLLKNLVVNTVDPALKIGDGSWRVFGMTVNLAACGYLWRPYFHFNREVHGAVVRFKKFHHIHIDPKHDGGIVDIQTDVQIKHAADFCRKHHHKEVHP